LSTAFAQCRFALLTVCLLAICERAPHAAVAVDVVSVDLAPLIDAAAKSPTQFAVDVPHAVSAKTNGEWSESNGIGTWTYAVQIPGAVSMSFHASEAALPPSATLTITADGVNYVYTAKELHGGEYWSRIGRGDSLTFLLSVASEDVGAVRLAIVSFQAGYRSLGDDARANAYDDGLRKRALATPPAACAQNWTCNVTTTNSGPGNATVAIVINNTALCTAVLMNNVAGDGAPYLLTARHCQNGSSDGGLPGAASSIVVYWNAVSACGSPLGSVFDPNAVAQYGGADTVVEQQDAWLVRLRQAPAVDAYYAGWDATGGAFVGGFSPHHASATSRQFVGWYGQAAYLTFPPERFQVKYTSTFWGTVNSVGAGGPGSSGAGLFNDTGHLVGTIARGNNAADGSGICPTNPPVVPTDTTATALSTAFSGVFSSTSDPGSTTGAATLQTVLDPGNTGTLVLDGRLSPIIVTLRNYPNGIQTGTYVTLDWSTSVAGVSCTASGGEAGDGWPGAVPSNSSKSVTSFDGGAIAYTIACTSGQRSGSASVTLHWVLAIPSITINGPFAQDFGVASTLSWNSNVRPCTATGGNAGDGWGGAEAPQGSVSVKETIVGQVTYTLTCGSDTRVATQQLIGYVNAPSVSVQADAATLRLGEVVHITTAEHGAPCVKSGGSAGDGWAGQVPGVDQFTSATLTETVPGTYTYAIACGTGSYVATAQVTVTFRNDPPAVSVRLSATTQTVDGGMITASWDANVRDCTTTVTGPGENGASMTAGPVGSITIQEHIIGRYVFDVTCGAGATTAHASAAMDWTGTPSLQIESPNDAVRGIGFYIAYFSNVVPCTTSGGNAGDTWVGQYDAPVRFFTVVEQTAGRQTYTVTCGSGAQTVTKSVTVNIAAEAPRVTLTANPPQQITGRPITVSWDSNVSQCSAFGGRSGDGWGGARADSGSVTITEPTPGNITFSMTCGTGDLTAINSLSVEFADVPAPTLTASRTEGTVGDTLTLTWSSPDGSACLASGGDGPDGWYGSRPASGSIDLTLVTTGNAYYSLVCGASLTATVRVTVNAPVTPQVTLTASVVSLALGDSFALTYTVSGADTCMASGGSANDGWTGTLPKQGGSVTVKPVFSGVLLYTITCLAGSATGTANATVTVTSTPAPPASSGGGGGGGGGSMGPVDLAFFLSLGLAGYWQRRRTRLQLPAENRTSGTAH
jgi:hypothetical protein